MPRASVFVAAVIFIGLIEKAILSGSKVRTSLKLSLCPLVTSLNVLYVRDFGVVLAMNQIITTIIVIAYTRTILYACDIVVTVTI
jgi:nitrate/nitrite transporter NarK